MIASTSSMGSAARYGRSALSASCDVGHLQDAVGQVELVGGQAVGIAAAVQALVVGPGQARDVGQRGHGIAGSAARARDGGASATHSSSVELARLVEDAVGDAELADVVQQAGAAQQRGACARVEAERDGDGLGDLAPRPRSGCAV